MTVRALIVRLHRQHADATAARGAHRALHVGIHRAGGRRGRALRVVGRLGLRVIRSLGHDASISGGRASA